MRLAAHLKMTLAELRCRMSSAELTEWLAFDSLEPIDGERRADLRAGIIASTVANCHRKKDSRPFQPRDFMPDFDDSLKPQEQPVDEMLAIAKALAKSGLGTIKTGG